MKRKQTKIQTKLFIVNLLIVLLLSAAFFSVLILWQVNYYKNTMLESLNRDANSILWQIDEGLSAMNNISLNIVYSNIIKERFNKLSEDYMTAENIPSIQTDQNSQYLVEMLFATIGPNLLVPQIYIYGTQEGCFGTGIDNGYCEITDTKAFEQIKVSVQESKKFFSSPHEDERLYSAARHENGNKYISLIRQTTNNLNVPQGYVEVIQRYDQIVSPAKNSEMDILIVRKDGEIIYPLNPADIYSEKQIYSFGSPIKNNTYGTEWKALPQINSMALFLESQQSEFIIVSSVTNSQLMSGFKPLFISLLGVELLVILLMAPFVYLFSKSFTKPIYQLYDIVSHLNLETLDEEQYLGIKSNILELNELNTKIGIMKHKLSTSMKQLLLSQNHEIQSRILALQAQTNPHFIYNTLFTIASMASSNMNEEIEILCEKLAGFLRYSSSAKDSIIKLEHELEYTQMYIDCMKIRFPGLSYHVNISQQAKNILVPKLMVQLLVENSVKYCTSKKAPWIIEVTGAKIGEMFSLKIADNGPGFSEDAINRINNEIEKMNDTKLMPALEFNGMGILNVYIRTLLVYKNDVSIKIENSASGGAVIEIKMPVLSDSNERSIEDA